MIKIYIWRLTVLGDITWLSDITMLIWDKIIKNQNYIFAQAILI